MLNDASGFRRIYLATGYTDLRRGMEGLASIIKFNFQLDPYQKDILFLFCGRRTDRIKGLGLGRRRLPASIQKTGVGCIQLAPHKRRSIGDHPRAVPISHAGTGNCCTPSDPGSQTG